MVTKFFQSKVISQNLHKIDLISTIKIKFGLNPKEYLNTTKNVSKEKDIDLILVMEEEIRKCKKQLLYQWVKNTNSISVVVKMKTGMNKNLQNLN